MLTFLTERHICVYKRDIDNALGKYRKYMVGEPELMNGAIFLYRHSLTLAKLWR